MATEVRPLAGALGAEVFGVDIATKISDSEFSEIYNAFLENLVLFFRRQRPLTPAQHTAFAARFGEVDYEPFAYPIKPPAVAGCPQILVNVKEASDRSINVGGLWHADVTFRVRPHKTGVIYAKDAPPFGGDTMFANQYLAFESLSDGMRALLQDLQAEHSSEWYMEASQPDQRQHHAPMLPGQRTGLSRRACTRPRSGWTRQPTTPLCGRIPTPAVSAST